MPDLPHSEKYPPKRGSSQYSESTSPLPWQNPELLQPRNNPFLTSGPECRAASPNLLPEAVDAQSVRCMKSRRQGFSVVAAEWRDLPLPSREFSACHPIPRLLQTPH